MSAVILRPGDTVVFYTLFRYSFRISWGSPLKKEVEHFADKPAAKLALKKAKKEYIAANYEKNDDGRFEKGGKTEWVAVEKRTFKLS